MALRLPIWFILVRSPIRHRFKGKGFISLPLNVWGFFEENMMLDNLMLLFVWAPVMNVQMILEGIFIGAVFALGAYGLALVWGVMNVKNLAQGDFIIMGWLFGIFAQWVWVSSIIGFAHCDGDHVYLWLGHLCNHYQACD